jgi:hypothetical protein
MRRSLRVTVKGAHRCPRARTGRATCAFPSSPARSCSPFTGYWDPHHRGLMGTALMELPMSTNGFGLALSCGLVLLGSSAFAQNQNTNNSGQKPSATQQLKATATGAQSPSTMSDGAKARPNPVQANLAPKPSPVGQPIHSTATTPGYKPAQPSLHTNPVPLPASVAQRPATQPAVARSTATVSSPPPTVARSSTTATVPAKKP